MIIEVHDDLLELINKVEKSVEESDKAWKLPILWAYGDDGQFANGCGNRIEFDIAVGENEGGKWQSVACRETGKYDNDNWETHPLDTDYEGDEDENI